MNLVTKFRLIPAFLLAFVATAWADPFAIWPPEPGAPPGTPVATFPASDSGWTHYFYDHIIQSKTVPVDLLFDGDSITDHWQDTGKNVWQQRYGALNPFDFGISADRIQNVLWRLHHGELDGLHPKLIVLMIGTNNLSGDSVDEIAQGIKNLVGEYRTRSPHSHLLLLGIFPRGASPTDPVRAKIAQVNQSIAKLDDGQNITFLDIGAKFLQPDGTLTAEIMPDFLHPSEKGYKIWADAIQPIIDQYCPKSAATAPTSTPSSPVPPLTPVTWPLPPRPVDITNETLFPLPQVGWHFQVFNDHLRALNSGPWDVVFDGDDLTDRWEWPDGGQDVWKERYGAIKALDIGIDGDQVQNVLWRVRHMDLVGPDPRLIVLLVGNNNVGQEPKDIAAGIKLIVNEYETRSPDSHILLLGLLPRDREAQSGERVAIAKVNQILATYDDGKRVTFMDMGAKFLNPDGTMMEDAMANDLRPTKKGYEIWADAIQPVIDKYIPKAAAK